MRYAQIHDFVEDCEAAAPEIDTSALIGVWVNSNRESRGIARMAVAQFNGKLTVHVQAVGPDGLIDWGMADITVFASGPTSRLVAGFSCSYDFGFVETRLQAMVMKGLIVLAELHRFKDGSDRADYFVREYFASEHGIC